MARKPSGSRMRKRRAGATRTRRKTVRSAPRSAARLDAHVRRLRSQLKNAEKRISTARDEQQQAAEAQKEVQGKLLRATSDKNDLEDALKMIEGARAAIGKEREAAAADAKDARAERDEIQKKVAKDRRHADLKAAVESVEAEVTKQTAEVERAEGEVQKAKADDVAAREALARMERTRADRLDELRKLPEHIRAARGQIARVRATMKAADQGGRMWELYALKTELDAALKALDEKAGAAREARLATSLLDTDPLANARDRAEAAAKALKDRKDKLEEARRDLQATLQSRYTTIRKKLEE